LDDYHLLDDNRLILFKKTGGQMAEPSEEVAAAAAVVPTSNARVALREINKESVYDILKLKVTPGQEQFVAPNAVSIAEAYYEPKAWFRAIYADETPVGFVMLYDDPDEPVYFLWRLMVDARYQALGFGLQAMHQLIDYVRSRPGAKELLVSYVPAEGSPEQFYKTLGFVNTGKMHGDEMEMRLEL
jgi:diamine N-acetyltransferase